MLGELNRNRYKALELLAEHVRAPSRELSLDAIICDISDEDLKWVTNKVHYYLLAVIYSSFIHLCNIRSKTRIKTC